MNDTEQGGNGSLLATETNQLLLERQPVDRCGDTPPYIPDIASEHDIAYLRHARYGTYRSSKYTISGKQIRALNDCLVRLMTMTKPLCQQKACHIAH